MIYQKLTKDGGLYISLLDVDVEVQRKGGINYIRVHVNDILDNINIIKHGINN